jgi:periplasmic divalent cation tolerance protein
MSQFCIVLSTCPPGEVAQHLAQTLVSEQLAACVNIVPGLKSVYLWQGRQESSDESLLVIKTRLDAYPKLEERLRALHPYELPEILMVRVDTGLGAYLGWLESSVTC